MLQIDSLLLEAFYKENKDFFTNARVQKIQQPTRRDIILHLRNNSESKKFYININPDFAHICFMSKENEIRRNIEIPKQPPMFCMLLRKHMEGAKILSITKPDYERILELNFENYNELGDRIEECLSIELMGKHSNAVLYNTDNNIILGCAHNIGEEKSKEREMAGGLPYIYPPKQNKKNLLLTRYDWFLSALKKSDKELKKAVSDRYFYLSQAVVQEICISQKIAPLQKSFDITEREAQLLYTSLYEFLEKSDRKYTVSKDFTKYSCINKLERSYNSINELIDDYFSYNIEKGLISSLQTSLKSKINKELKKLNNTNNIQKKQLEKENKAKEYMTRGNLLTANSYAIGMGVKSVLLKDYETEKMIEISLDENLNPIENAQRYFNLYNKSKRAFQIALKMSEQTQEELRYYKQILYDIENTESYAELKEIALELEPEKKHTHKKKENHAISVLKLDIEGFSVYVGKNNKQNDYLYSKISSPDDLWFHTLNTPGSHIIVKAPDSRVKITDNIILEVAKLAKQYSTAKNSTKVSVVYTLRKYIKRPNNTKSGFVVYKNEKEIVVD